MVAAVRDKVRAIDPALPLGNVLPLTELRDRTYLFASRPAWALGTFAAVAVLLAALGLYGVLAQSVTHRRREIGIRMALGASPGRLVRQTVASAVGMIALGSLGGLAAAIALVPVIRSLLFGVSGIAPFLLAGGVCAMWVIGLAATLMPARRAARVDPLVALREEA